MRSPNSSARISRQKTDSRQALYVGIPLPPGLSGVTFAMAKNAGVRLSSGGRIICPKMISPQYVLQSPRHRRSQRREQRAGWPSLKQAVGTRVLHDQLGSTKEGRPKSAGGEGSQLAHGRFGTSLPRIAIHHALISGLLTGHSGPEPVVFCCAFGLRLTPNRHKAVGSPT